MYGYYDSTKKSRSATLIGGLLMQMRHKLVSEKSISAPGGVKAQGQMGTCRRMVETLKSKS